ncbi:MULTISPECIES: hypothetical protein [unclassified Leucobacter]|uniref:hypothetical protein n=1 Tax=unclassified Leucobacter TaxID=2621730 RepID=UPI00301A93F9
MIRRALSRTALISRSARLAGIAAAAALTTAALAPTSAVAAGGDVLEVSPDGVVFTHTFSGLLAGTVLVPQGHSQESFFVRNAGAEDGYLHVGLTGIDVSDPLLEQSLSAELQAPGNGIGSALFSAADPCVELLSAIPLAAHSTVPLTAGLVLGDLDGIDGQGESVSFQLRFVITSEAIGSTASGCAASAVPAPSPGLPQISDPRPPQLGVTGAAAPILALALAVGLLTAGTTLISARRRRRQEQDT